MSEAKAGVPHMISPGDDGAPARVLVVDDVAGICDVYRDAVRRARAPVELVTETDAGRALQRVLTEDFHLVVSDYRMPKANGLEILTAARGHSPRGYRVLMTSYNEIPASEGDLRAAGVDAYLQKPFLVHDLVAMIRAFAMENRSLIRTWQEEAHEMERSSFVSSRGPGRDHA